ncbi:MAG: hypothetical protein Q8O19_04680, partial [Rectinemataceae bacterium]|nr:hypothetical protein [Rectinemataceae bacterium]
ELGLVTLLVNGNSAGDVQVFFSNSDYYVDLLILSTIMLDFTNPGFHSEIFKSKLKSLRWAGSRELNAAGFIVTEDPNTLTFSIVVPPSKRPVNDIRITNTAYNYIKPILLPSPFSAVLSTEIQAGLDFSVSGFSLPLSWLCNLYLNFSDWIIETNSNISLNKNNFSGSIPLARFVHDFGSLGARLYGGMVSSTSLGYQSSSSLYGLTLDSFNFVQGRRSANAPVSRFVLEEKSVVRIILNGTTLLTLNLDPGTYDVGQFDFAPGINDFLIEIEAPGKAIQRLHAVVSREDVLLGKDTSEFSISAGVGRINLGEVFASAFYRKGFADYLTAGTWMQAGKYSGLVGLTGVFASPLGAFSLNAGNMFAWDGRLAQAVNLKYKLAFPGRVDLPAFGLDFEIRTKDFEAPRVGAIPTYPEASISVSASISTRLFSDSFIGLGGSYTRQTTGTFNESISGSVSFNLSLRPGHSILFSGGLTQSTDTPLSASASIRLSIAPNKGIQFFNFNQTMKGDNSINISTTASDSGLEASFQGDNVLGNGSTPASLSFSARKTALLFDFNGNVDMQYSDPDFPGFYSLTTVSASTSFAYVNGTFAMARRISDSFLIFSPPQSLVNERIDIRSTSGQTGSSINGSAVVLPLTSYQSGLATLNLPESDPNIVLKTVSATVSPRYRSGIFFTTNIVRSHSVTATLVDTKGLPLGYIMAEVLNQNGESIASTFTDENGYFELYDLLGGIYTVRWPLDMGVTYFEIPEDSPKDLTLGTVSPSLAQEGGTQ